MLKTADSKICNNLNNIPRWVPNLLPLHIPFLSMHFGKYVCYCLFGCDLGVLFFKNERNKYLWGFQCNHKSDYKRYAMIGLLIQSEYLDFHSAFLYPMFLQSLLPRPVNFKLNPLAHVGQISFYIGQKAPWAKKQVKPRFYKRLPQLKESYVKCLSIFWF